jgi:hypothetical protein
MASSAGVIDTAKFSVSVLNDILSQLGNASRKIAISIDNQTGRVWNKGSVYFESGTSDSNLPSEVEDKQTLLLGCRKSSGFFILRGTDGVVTFFTPDKHTIAIMWSVPFNYSMFINWWNVAVFPSERKASKELFDEMYNLKGQPFIGDNEWKQRSLELGYRMRGAMAGSMHATMEIHIEKEDVDDTTGMKGV